MAICDVRRDNNMEKETLLSQIMALKGAKMAELKKKYAELFYGKEPLPGMEFPRKYLGINSLRLWRGSPSWDRFPKKTPPRKGGDFFRNCPAWSPFGYAQGKLTGLFLPCANFNFFFLLHPFI
jgi:hypothetical protein